MTQFVPNSYPDFDTDSSGMHVAFRDRGGSHHGLVTYQTGPGGVVRNSLGELIWRPGMNQLIRVAPTPVCNVANVAGATMYSGLGTSPAFAAADVDPMTSDPATGLPALVCTTSASSGAHRITWDGLPQQFYAPDDVLMVSVWLPWTVVTSSDVTLRVSSGSTMGATPANYREFSWRGLQLKPGWNLLTVCNTEDGIATNEYGRVGTFGGAARQVNWSYFGTDTHESGVRSMEIRLSNLQDRTVKIGGILRAPARWAVSAVMLGFDDVPNTAYTYSCPEIERRGWRCSLNVISTYTVPGLNPTFLSIEQVRELNQRGHEIWGHTATHNYGVGLTEAELQREYGPAAQFWVAQGITSAAKYMVYPGNSVNAQRSNLARAAGYKLGRSNKGDFNPWIAGAQFPMSLPTLSCEPVNNWDVYSELNGKLRRGQSISFHGHRAVAGGQGLNTYPGSIQHYQYHYEQWLDMIAAAEAAGDAVVLRFSDYFRACGIDPDGPFYE